MPKRKRNCPKQSSNLRESNAKQQITYKGTDLALTICDCNFMDASCQSNVIWAKIYGHCWWPAQVIPKDAALQYFGTQSEIMTLGCDKVIVIFFGKKYNDDREFGLCKTSSEVLSWGEGIKHQLHVKGQKSKQRVRFVEALYEVVQFLWLDHPRKMPINWWCYPPAVESCSQLDMYMDADQQNISCTEDGSQQYDVQAPYVQRSKKIDSYNNYIQSKSPFSRERLASPYIHDTVIYQGSSTSDSRNVQRASAQSFDGEVYDNIQPIDSQKATLDRLFSAYLPVEGQRLPSNSSLLSQFMPSQSYDIADMVMETSQQEDIHQNCGLNQNQQLNLQLFNQSSGLFNQSNRSDPASVACGDIDEDPFQQSLKRLKTENYLNSIQNLSVSNLQQQLYMWNWPLQDQDMDLSSDLQQPGDFKQQLNPKRISQYLLSNMSSGFQTEQLATSAQFGALFHSMD